MTYEIDPPRLRVSGDPSDPLVRALEAARMELPTVEELEALAGRLPAMSGKGGLGAGPFSRTRLRAKSVQAGLFALAAAVGVGATMKYEGVFPFGRASRAPEASSPAPAPAPVPAPRRAEVKAQATPAPSAAPLPSAVPVQAEPPESRPRNAPSGVKARSHDVPSSTAPSQGDLPASDVDGRRTPEEESALLGRAHQALSADPAQALALTERHRRDYPSGALGQESDLIAIEALVALGKTGEAEVLAARFRAHYPSSAHLRRLDRLVGESAPRPQ